MEFKVIRIPRGVVRISHINRIKVEFKGLSSLLAVAAARILIESKWNLKNYVSLDMDELGEILIESKWNLKMFTVQFRILEGDYINRIKVEFKV